MTAVAIWIGMLVIAAGMLYHYLPAILHFGDEPGPTGGLADIGFEAPRSHVAPLRLPTRGTHCRVPLVPSIPGQRWGGA